MTTKNTTKAQRDVELAMTAVRTARAKINRYIKNDKIAMSDPLMAAAQKQYDDALYALTDAQSKARKSR